MVGLIQEREGCLAKLQDASGKGEEHRHVAGHANGRGLRAVIGQCEAQRPAGGNDGGIGRKGGTVACAGVRIRA